LTRIFRILGRIDRIKSGALDRGNLIMRNEKLAVHMKSNA